MRTLATMLVLSVLTACSQSAGPSATDGLNQPSPTPSTDLSSPPAPTGSTSPSPSTTAGAPELATDGLAVTRVDGLSVRDDPSIAAALLGTLPTGEPAYVVDGPVEADGYQWYQLASVRLPYRGDCGDPAPEPSLECATWFGWAAGVTPDGERWLEPMTPSCPAERDTASYIDMLPAERLACGGDDEWRLVAYIAPEPAGRGCYPAWVIVPSWLEGACAFVFPQPDESTTDSDERLQAWVHPDLGTCPSVAEPGCPLGPYRGAWVEMIGHLDDPAASTCRSEPTGVVPEDQLGPPPDPEQTVFSCRLRLVVTELLPAQAPEG